MQAIVIHEHGGADKLSLETVEKPVITQPFDILVRNHAASINPVDYKKRTNFGQNGPLANDAKYLILGYDACGIVEAVGSHARKFNVGDKVWYAGALQRNGTNAQYTLVDERIVGHAPKSLSYEECAAQPLTVLTAWESFFEHFRIKIPNVFEQYNSENKKTILIINGAGGVGSIAIQIAKLVNLNVIATATRPESIAFCKKLGADHVISHKTEFAPQLKELNIAGVDYAFNCSDDTDKYLAWCIPILNPLGQFNSITNATKPVVLDGASFFKRLSFSYELMFTKPLYNVDLSEQGKILDTVAHLFDKKVFQTRVGKVFKFEEFKQAHEQQESGTTLGKNVIQIP